jgi:transcriptional regulator with XRE-family HTH domain
MTRERGSGRTPERVVKLINDAVSEKSIYAVSKETGLGLAAVSRYMKAVGEPTTATLQKIAKWSGKPVGWLRLELPISEEFEDTLSSAEFAEGLVEICRIIPKHLHKWLRDLMEQSKGEIENALEKSKTINYLSNDDLVYLEKVHDDIVEVLEIGTKLTDKKVGT